MLVTAQRIGLRIHEVPVDWVDDTDSRVDVVHTASRDLRGVSGCSDRRPAPARPLGRPPDGPGGLDPGRPAIRPSPARRQTGPSSRRTVVGPDRPVGPAMARCRSPASRSTAGLGPGCPGQVFADELLRFAGVGAVSTVGLRRTVRRPRTGPGRLPGQHRGHRACAAWATPPPTGAWPAPPASARPTPSAADRRRTVRRQPGLHHWGPGRHPGRRPSSPRPRALRRDRGQRWGRRHPVRHPAHMGVPAPSSAPTCGRRRHRRRRPDAGTRCGDGACAEIHRGRHRSRQAGRCDR